MVTAASLLWFRHDLRLADNPALNAALARGRGLVPVFIWQPEEEGAWPPGAASRWWLHQSLAALDRELRARGSRLIIRRGPSGDALERLLRETGAKHVFWNRRYEPAVVARDASIKASLSGAGIAVSSFNASLLREPWENTKASGEPYRVFTPFWRALLKRGEFGEPEPAPTRLPSVDRALASIALEDLQLEPRIDWAAGMRSTWSPGEAGAQRRLEDFLSQATQYADMRDRPDRDGVSQLSPHLHFGEIGPRQIWHRVEAVAGNKPGARDAVVEGYLRQLVWRDFAHHLLYYFPQTAEEPLRLEFAEFPWLADAPELRAWQRGRTGYPLVDAGMRQLWHTGWMHNRVRMVVASFLVKHLLITWRQGARWFWDTLVDADLANNTLGWQWTAGCGADAAPYFRIFNPTAQGEKFDPQGGYVRRWVPELARLPAEWIHRPHEAPDEVLQSAGIELGRDYPRPLVDHAVARGRALDALGSLKAPQR